MKNLLRYFGIIIMIVIIGFLFTACDVLNDEDDDNSTSTSSTSALYGWYGNGTAISYTISTAAQLRGLSDIVRGVSGEGIPSRDDFAGKTINLNADINLNDQVWKSIGYTYLPNVSPFNGTFDGNNKTISNFYTTEQQGFFGLIGEHGIVKNIIFTNFNVTGSDGVGGLTRTNRGMIQNIIINNGNVSSNWGLSGVGGIAFSNSGIIQDSSFSGIINPNSTSANAGGIASSNSQTIRNCTVSGTVTGSTHSSGIVGVVGSNSGIVENSFFN